MASSTEIGLYVHWPFCQAKCPYCDFNSHVVARVDQSRWAQALVTEIERYGAALPGARVKTIFFGGGTPSLMRPQTVEAVIAAAQRVWTLANDAEITLEANPTSVEADRFTGYRIAGVNRVSLGVQALNDTDLKRLGRLHDSKGALRALEVARTCFDRVSFDLIYARQFQTLENWRSELNEALGMAPDHLSLYQLTIEQGTAFGDRANHGRLPGLPGEDLAADMWDVTQEMTTNAGLPAYEVSNHAQPGAESRHNLIYWRGGDYVGIGPGAHGRVLQDGTRFATEAERIPAKWIAQIESGDAPDIQTAMKSSEILEERIMMGLRLSEGIPASLLKDYFRKLNSLTDLELVEVTENHVRATSTGRPLLNAILRDILV
ncbi:radical SAM family heme chaperone HemW [Palleronia caenipelagi]|uniref:Heme chaperone HemW n=1 Tax=Palleronia caenipelagi TaxID=2489174 RepID=A0A547Q8T3_9RHOB|nr:radical SAM family heme chaperone HemW [Palleronia caenipelagi]TRD22780.1 coproporphyrinogen III oxidase [Palleronia caenipelagi]